MQTRTFSVFQLEFSAHIKEVLHGIQSTALDGSAQRSGVVDGECIYRRSGFNKKLNDVLLACMACKMKRGPQEIICCINVSPIK